MTITYAIQSLIQSVDKHDIKLSLLWKSETPFQWAIYSLFVSIILLTITRINNPSFVPSLLKSLYKNRAIEKIVLDESPLNKIAQFCLISNFILSFTIITSFLVSENYHVFGWLNWLIAISLPVYLLVGPLFYLSLVEFITGENHFSKEIKLTNRILCQFLGIIGTLFLLIWIFIQHSHTFISYFTLSIISITYIFRLFRGFVFAFSKGLPWYYIILYFCTFELLPLYIVYHYLSGVYI
jgi:hypothetical protein